MSLQSCGAAPRGCGKRKKGGVYAEVPLSEDGLPIEAFLKDEPIEVSVKDGVVYVYGDDGVVAVPSRGVHLVKTGGVVHVFDRVGVAHYPDVATWVEEARRQGVSRRCELPDYSLLDPSRSRLVLLHDRAWIENAADYLAAMNADEDDDERARFWCPRRISRLCGTPPHLVEDLDHHCSGLWWHDISDGDGGGPVEVKLASGGSYHAWRRPESIQPDRHPAIFAVFPLGRLVVVNDPDGRSHEGKVEKISRSQYAVVVEEV